MSRTAAGPDRRGIGRTVLAAGALLALLAGLAHVVLGPAPVAEPPVHAAPVGVVAAPAGAMVAVKAPAPAPESPQAQPVVPAAAQVKVRAASRAADVPYRFVGKSAVCAETSIVLFGRGRLVTLRGPGPLDDEYMVDAVFDDYIVVRHVPTGVGKFMALSQRLRVVEPPEDPEASPRD
jgi:hypothetical protein